MIHLSKNAIVKLKEMNKKWIKVKVFFGGCNGFKYDFSFPIKSEKSDVIFEFGEEAGIITDEFTSNKINNATIDFVDNLMEEKFYITSNDFKKTCHCGTSFKA